MIVFNNDQISLLSEDSEIFEQNRKDFINQTDDIENIGEVYHQATQVIIMSFYLKAKVLNQVISLRATDLNKAIHNFIHGIDRTANLNTNPTDISFDIIFDLKQKTITNLKELPDNTLINLLKDLEV